MAIGQDCIVYIQYESAYGEKPDDCESWGVKDTGTGECSYYISEGDLPVLSEEGKDFLGWTYNGEYVYEGDTVYSYESPFYFTYVAVWAEDFTITYETAHGTTPSSYEYDKDVGLTEEALPTLTDENDEYIFVGWTQDGETILKAGDTVVVAPFIAVWQAKQFKRPYLDKTGLSHFLAGLWQKITAKMTAETDRATAAEEALDAKIVQADWNENDETSMAYIINKPDFVAITTAEIDEICVDFTLDEASAVLTEIDEVIGG